MRVTVSVPDRVGRDAEAFAREEELSVSALFARAVEEYLRNVRRQRAIERIGGLIGTTYVAPDAEEELERARKGSDRTFE